MPRSVNRFLTTHTGSLPRPDDLTLMMYAKEEGRAGDRQALAQRIRTRRRSQGGGPGHSFKGTLGRNTIRFRVLTLR